MMASKEVDGLRQRTQEKLKMELNESNEDKYRGNKIQKIGTIKEIRKRMQELRQDAVIKVDEYLKEMVSEMVEGVQHIEKNKDLKNCIDECYNDKKKQEESDRLPEKDFQIRNSILIDLCNEVSHLRTVYNIFVVILIIQFMYTAVHDYLETESLYLGFRTMKLGFSKIPYVFNLWLQMMAFTIAVYVVYTIWAQKRMEMPLKSLKIKIWDYSWLFTFITYQIAFLIIIAKRVWEANLPPPCVCIILFEQLRIVMKIHAFVRTTVPKVISYKPHTENSDPPVPGFSKFIYFMFAPTIVYRDNYPRTKEIRWSLVVWFFVEFFLALCFVTFMFEKYVIPSYKDYGLEPYNYRLFILRYFNTVLPGFVIFICGFYCLLHTWMNAFAEMLRFGDRLFYKDWWNSMSYEVFYRTWNVVVHDWLYVYIYKDIYEIVTPRKKFFAKFSVFFVSAIFHEYILGLSLRLLCPISIVVFGGIGFLLTFAPRNCNIASGNIFIWFSLITGFSLMLSLYAMEYFARINCPSLYDNIYDLLMPRFLLCYK